jgi:hypothetical protein
MVKSLIFFSLTTSRRLKNQGCICLKSHVLLHGKLGRNKCSLQREEVMSPRAPLRFGGKAAPTWWFCFDGCAGGLRRVRRRKSGPEAMRELARGSAIFGAWQELLPLDFATKRTQLGRGTPIKGSSHHIS